MILNMTHIVCIMLIVYNLYEIIGCNVNQADGVILCKARRDDELLKCSWRQRAGLLPGCGLGLAGCSQKRSRLPR